MRRRKRRRSLIERMHPTLQILSILIGGFAFVGWSMAGIWFLYLIMM